MSCQERFRSRLILWKVDLSLRILEKKKIVPQEHSALQLYGFEAYCCCILHVLQNNAAQGSAALKFAKPCFLGRFSPDSWSVQSCRQSATAPDLLGRFLSSTTLTRLYTGRRLLV